MLFKENVQRPVVQTTLDAIVGPPVPADGTADAGIPPASDGPSVLINCGVHSGSYPVVGMSVASARRLLAPMMNIDPSAIAVIGGQRIEDEETRRINAVDGILSFVKESSLKGGIGAAGPGTGAGRRP